MKCFLSFTAVLLLTLCSASVGLAQNYTITDLGTLPGDSFSYGRGINNLDQVTGNSQTATVSHAFLYSGGIMTDIGTLGGDSVGYGINAAGQVTGDYYLTPGGITFHAFLYSNGAMSDLGTLGGTRSIGQGINTSGQVTGYSDVSGNNATHAFLYSNGTMSDLGTLGGNFSSGQGINDSGQVSGYSYFTPGGYNVHAFLYSNGIMTDIGTLGGTSSYGYGINSAGQIAGYSLLMDGTTIHAFLYRDGIMTDIGTLGTDSFSIGQGINNSGQVTGYSYPTLYGSGDSHAFLYTSSTGMVDLNSLIPSGSGWTLMQAYAINDAGRITGVGVNPNGQQHAFLLTPSSASQPPSIISISPTSGTQGQTIPNFTITGTNFDSSASQLSFSPPDGITVAIQSRTTTKLVATIAIASGAPVGLRDVIVTNSDGQRAVKPGAVSIIALPIIPAPAVGIGPVNPSTNPQGQYAEPISTGNGNYIYQHTDFVIPGRALPLIFQRAYNTLDNYSGPLGANWTHSYNILLGETSTGDIVIRWGDGHGETFAWNGSTYTPQPGVFSILAKNTDGTFVLTRKDQTRYTFSSTGKLTSIQDKNGNTILLGYDGAGRLSQITDTVERNVVLSYDGNNRISQVTDPIGRSVSFQYGANGDLISASDAAGTTQFAYDNNHRVTSITLPTGQLLLQNAYDATGRVVSQTNGRGASTTLSYGVPNPGETTITDARGNQTIHTYDGGLRIVGINDAGGGRAAFSYDANNNRISATNQAGAATGFAYDAQGNIIGIVDSEGNTISFAYDNKNDLLAATNAKGKATSFAYDGKGNLVAITDALGKTIAFAYDAFGQLTSKTDARGSTTTFAYDTGGNLIKITDALGNPTSLSYDGIGRLTSIKDAKSHTASATYDALSRLIKIADPLGNQTQFAYDAVGNLVKLTDAKGNATKYAYDATNNLVTVTDALGNVTHYSYDGNNNRTSFSNAKGKITSYAYDMLNRLASITDPLSFASSYAYDAVGNVTAITDAKGNTNRFAYDALNRLVGISYADGKSVTYAYDANGNRTGMADSRGTTTYAYDALDRLVSVTHPGSKVVTYGYDAVGNRVSLRYPDGKIVNYAYDSANRLSSATDWLLRSTTYTYDAANNLDKVTYPNKTGAAYTYDASNRLTKVVDSALNLPLLTLAYTLDPVGNRTKLSVDGIATSFGYDALNQLVSAQLGLAKSTWTYDAAGNRAKETSPLGMTMYAYDAADRLLSAGSTAFAYDANGNRVAKTTPRGTMTYSYDAANRLTAAVGLGANSGFGYDGDGNRISQSTSSGAYSYVNDVATSLPVVLKEQGPDGDIAYAYGLGLIEEASSTFNYFYHYDGLGSVVALTDAKGVPQAGYAYDAWGNPLLTVTDNVGTRNKFRFTGEALDPGTGLYYLRARYYDPSVGRFIGRDPLMGSAARPTGINRYVYGYDNPIAFSDPTGLSPTAAQFVAGYCGSLFGSYCDPIAETLRDEVITHAFEKLVPSFGGALASRGVPVSGALLGKIAVYPQAVLPLISVTANGIADATRHPERDTVEVLARFSIDLALQTSLALGSVVASPALFAAGDIAYGANREQIQNTLLFNPLTNFAGDSLFRIVGANQTTQRIGHWLGLYY